MNNYLKTTVNWKKNLKKNIRISLLKLNKQFIYKIST